MDAHAKSQEVERILNKTLEDYRSRLWLMKRRTQILAEIKSFLAATGKFPHDAEVRLLDLLDSERRLIGMLSDDGKLDIEEAEQAIRILQRARGNRMLVKELGKRDVTVGELERVIDFAAKLFGNLRTRLGRIEERILAEESLIGKISAEGNQLAPEQRRAYLDKYLEMWNLEISDEEKFRKSLSHVRSSIRLRAIGSIALAVAGSFTIPAVMIGLKTRYALFGRYYVGGSKEEIEHGLIGLALMTAILCINALLQLSRMAEEEEMQLDLESQNLFKVIKSKKDLKRRDFY